MNSFWRIFSLELSGLWRSKTLPILLSLAVAWMFLSPEILKGDGTIEGARELYLRFSLGGVFTMLLVALVFTATAAISKEREAHRLQLTMVRPVRYMVIALAKSMALTLAGFLVLTLSAVIAAMKVDISAQCNHVLSPKMESPRSEAERMYKSYMEDPTTATEIKKAKKALVLRILTQRAIDHFQTIDTKGEAEWAFDIPKSFAAKDLSARIRFTNLYDMRSSVFGKFLLEDREGVVSNITQAILAVPLKTEKGDEQALFGEKTLRFVNEGNGAVMLRSRKDIHLLIPADTLLKNLIRSVMELTLILGFVIALSVFLGAALSRPVATFVAIVLLMVTEMSPSVIEQYPDELETKTIDRIGLVLTRGAEKATRPLSSLNPLEALSRNECVEWKDVGEAALINLLLAQLLFSLLSSFVLPRNMV